MRRVNIRYSIEYILHFDREHRGGDCEMALSKDPEWLERSAIGFTIKDIVQLTLGHDERKNEVGEECQRDHSQEERNRAVTDPGEHPTLIR